MMDHEGIMHYLSRQQTNYKELGSTAIITALNHNEYHEREVKKDEIFLKRLDFICLCSSLKESVLIESGYKQLKRYFMNSLKMDESLAKSSADKYNEGARVFNRFDEVVKNCEKCNFVDIRDLNVHEYFLALNLSWVMRRNATLETKMTIPINAEFVEIDQASVNECVQGILRSDWFKAARCKPNLVATVMNRISDRVVRDAIYHTNN